MIMLDTNFLIAAEEPGGEADRMLRGWLAQRERIGICSLAWTEYLCGPLSPGVMAAADLLCAVKEPFLIDDAPLAAHLFNDSGRRRGTLTDCMIAAVAIRSGASLATLNRADFAPFCQSGLTLA